MTDKTFKDPVERVRHAKGAARETIGKLIGDDTAISQGRKEQEAAARPKKAGPAQEPKEQE